MKICAHANQDQNDYLLKDEWYIEPQKVTISGTTSHNEWQRVTMSDPTNDNEWQGVVQQVKTNGNEWKRMTLIDLNPIVQCNSQKCKILNANLAG